MNKAVTINIRAPDIQVDNSPCLYTYFWQTVIDRCIIGRSVNFNLHVTDNVTDFNAFSPFFNVHSNIIYPGIGWSIPDQVSGFCINI